MSALKVGGALTDKKFEPKMKLENEAGLIKNNFFQDGTLLQGSSTAISIPRAQPMLSP